MRTIKRKINYDRQMQETIAALQGEKPQLLLHVCCAPCSTSVMKRLSEAFRLVVYFDNPNMDSQEEFLRREKELVHLIDAMPWQEKPTLVVEPYTPEVFEEAIRGHEDAPEGGRRCSICYTLRLKRAAQYAASHNISWLTTTLSVSPHKDASRLNRIGSYWADRFGVTYLESDFKKRNGFKESCNLSDLYHLYRQDYCGCLYSKKEAEQRHRTKENL